MESYYSHRIHQTFWQLIATFVSGLAEMFGVIKFSVARDFH